MERRGGSGQGARLQHGHAGRPVEDHRSRRGVRHLRQLRRARPRPDRQDPRQDRPATKHTTTRPDYTASADDNAIIDGISGSDTSLGWVGFAFAEENKDKVQEIQVSKDPNGTCVSPDATTIADGSYPLSRSLYLYVNKAKAAANPALAAYVDYYLADGTISKVLETVPYVNLPTETLAATRATWDAAK